MKFFSSSHEELFKILNSSPNGLKSKQVEEKLAEFGKNELKEKEKTPLWELVLEQFKDQLVIILLMAAAVSLVLAVLESSEEDGVSSFVEPVVILLILIANAIVGVVQETNAEAAIDALKEYSPDVGKVMRDGEWVILDAKLLVPGDLVSLNVGDKVPADCRVLEITSSSFKVDQAILTGESFSVEKDVNSRIKDENAVLQDQLNMVFSGTSVTVGKALVMVVNTGERTEIGKIHESISEVESEKTPLKIALDDFGDQLSKIISVICLLVWLINIQHFNDPVHGGSWINGSIYYFKIAVALAVAAIPEGLSVIITTCLALGTQKMAKQGAIVRKLQSVETLGCTSVICSDKTGTLTTNQMSVRKVLVIDDKNKFLELDVEGNTYGLEGRVLSQSTPVIQAGSTFTMISELSTIAACCNDAKIVYDEKTDNFNRIGEPTEAALLTMVEKLGSDQNISLVTYKDEEEMKKASTAEKKARNASVSNHINSLNKRLLLLEFSRDRKSMSVVVERSESTGRKTRSSTASRSKKYLYCKGAPETVLERCKFYKSNADDKPVALTPALRDSILANVHAWGERDALRVLAFAYVENPEVPAKVDAADFANYESGMTFVGLVGMLDPPRPEVKDSIRKCRNAGIRVIVITGDNKKTAESICRQIGVFGEKEELKGKSFTGREFDAMSDDDKLKAVLKASLFSRTEPTHKSELVDLLKQQGFVVAMTGDGVNDAPALKKADIGIAMGSGTDVAKLASEMVLQDDNFSTIVSAVQEGRTIYSNTKQFIRYLISSNIGEVVSIFLTVVLGMPEALIPVQLLWVNLVTDGLPATALGFNPADTDIMNQSPRDSKEPIVTPWLFFRYFVIGIYVGGATVFGYAWWFMFYSKGPQISFYQLSNFHSCPQKFAHIGCEMFSNEMSHKATTMSLSILVVVEMFNAMNSLSENQSLLKFSLLNNIYLIYAIILSMVLHFMILYVPFFTALFSITELNYDEWMAVLAISFPVIVVDEVLKLISRIRAKKEMLAKRKLERGILARAEDNFVSNFIPPEYTEFYAQEGVGTVTYLCEPGNTFGEHPVKQHMDIGPKSFYASLDPGETILGQITHNDGSAIALQSVLNSIPNPVNPFLNADWFVFSLSPVPNAKNGTLTDAKYGFRSFVIGGRPSSSSCAKVGEETKFGIVATFHLFK